MDRGCGICCGGAKVAVDMRYYLRRYRHGRGGHTRYTHRMLMVMSCFPSRTRCVHLPIPLGSIRAWWQRRVHRPEESKSVPPGWKSVGVGVCCELAATVRGVVKCFNANWCIVCLCSGVQLMLVSTVPKIPILYLLICWQVWIHSDQVL